MTVLRMELAGQSASIPLQRVLLKEERETEETGGP
jgi:hypothetical protein